MTIFRFSGLLFSNYPHLCKLLIRIFLQQALSIFSKLSIFVAMRLVSINMSRPIEELIDFITIVKITWIEQFFKKCDADRKPLTGKDKMTYHSLAPLSKAPIDRKKAAVRGDGPPNSTSSEIKRYIFCLVNIW